MVLDFNILLIWIAIQVAFFIPMFYLMKNKLMTNTMAIFANLLFGFAMYWAVETVMSYPKPMEFEAWKTKIGVQQKQYTILQYVVDPGVAIYLYLDDGGSSPRSFSLRWDKYSKRLADELVIQSARAKRNGGKLKYNPSLGSEGVIAEYPAPQDIDKDGVR